MAAPWTRPHARCGRASALPSWSAVAVLLGVGALRRRRLGHGRDGAARNRRRGRRGGRPRRAGRAGPSRSRASTGRGSSPAAAAVGLVAWTGLTIWWSIAGDRSWDALAKGIVLLAFGVVGLAAARPPGPPAADAGAPPRRRCSAPSSCGRCSARRFPALGPDDAGRVARLKGSIGYWNALALLADAALGLGLWLVVSVRERFGTAGGRAAPLRGDARDPADPVARRAPRRGRRRRARARGSPDGRVEAALLGLLADRPGRGRRRLGVHAARARRGRRRARRPCLRRRASLGVLARRRRGRAVVALVALVPVARLVETRRREVVRGLVGAAALVAVVGAARPRRSASATRSRWAADQLGGSGEVVERPGPARQPRDEQPHRLVGRGVAGVPRPSGRRNGRAHVRDRAQAVPRRRRRT